MLLSPEGLRVDGRRSDELRRLSCRLGILNGSKCDGSSFFQQGNTSVIASVVGPWEPVGGVKSHRGSDSDGANKCVINCEYSMTSFSTMERKNNPGKRDRRAMEIGLLLRQTFEQVIRRERFPRSQIDIRVQVLSADGGTRCACINAITLALVHAGIPMLDMVAACAAGLVDDTPILDLNYREDSRGVDLPVAIMPLSGKVLMCQMDRRVENVEMFVSIMELAISGAREIAEMMKATILEDSKKCIGKK